MEDDPAQPPESLLPYDEWHDEAMRHIMRRAIRHAAAHGLPGDHHFYLTFRTGYPGVVIPDRLREKYPEEMTIVLQHQFWDLAMDDATGLISVGLSFGGVPSTLRIPQAAVTAFADPHARTGMHFTPPEAPAAPAIPPAVAISPVTALAAPDSDTPPEAAPETPPETPAETPQVVSLDAFRRRGPKE